MTWGYLKEKGARRGVPLIAISEDEGTKRDELGEVLGQCPSLTNGEWTGLPEGPERWI